MTLERYKHSSAGHRAILRSEGVRADLQARAERVAAVVRGQTDAEIIADSYIGTGRAGATVIGVPMSEERLHRILGRAIDAARG